ncbi:MAG: AAA family ATPase [bacterium]
MGPRQTGKTTLAKKFINSNKGFYYNWDKRNTKRA